MQAIQNLLAQGNTSLNQFYNNPYIASVLTLFFALYGGLAAPELPPVFAGLFGNSLFKGLIIFLIVYLQGKNPTLAILLTIGFILSLQTFHRYQSFTMLNELTNMDKMMKGLKELKNKIPGLLEAGFNALSNNAFYEISDAVREEVGLPVSKRVFPLWQEWLRKNAGKLK